MEKWEKIVVAVWAAAIAATLAWGGVRLFSEPEPPPDHLVRFTIIEQVSPTYLAYTQCTQIADSMATVSWVRTEVLDPDSVSDLLHSWDEEATYVDQNAIVAHEHAHKEQMRRFPDCAAASLWYRHNRIVAEAEAYCEAARVYHREHPKEATVSGVVFQYAKWLENYDRRLNHADAIVAIKEFCREA